MRKTCKYKKGILAQLISFWELIGKIEYIFYVASFWYTDPVLLHQWEQAKDDALVVFCIPKLGSFLYAVMVRKCNLKVISSFLKEI